MRNFIEKHKPDKIFLDPTSNAVIFLKAGKRSKVDLKTNETRDEMIETLRKYEHVASIQAVNATETVYTMQWNLSLKQDSVQPKRVDTTSTTAYAEEEVLSLNSRKGKDKSSNIKKILQSFDRLIVEQNVLQLTMTSSGTLLLDEKVSKRQIESHLIEELYEDFTRNEKHAVGSIREDVSVGNRIYALSASKVGNEISIRVSRILKEDETLRMNLPTEMKYRYSQLKSGLLITSLNNLVEMKHSLAILNELDEDYEKLSCVIGSANHSVGKLPSHQKLEVDYLRRTHYKYMIITTALKPNDLPSLLELVYAGKTLVVGFDNDSVYANLISLLSLCGEDKFTMNKVLMSTVGMIHPVVSLKSGTLSLENSECVTISSSKAKRILDGDLSKERFNFYIEKPSKVYSLGGGQSTFMSQEEELNNLLKLAIEQGASDIHLAVGAPPLFRIKKKLVPIDKELRLKPEVMDHITSLFVTSESQKSRLESDGELYLPYSVSGIGRFRVQIVTQRGTFYIVIRHTALTIPSAESMRIPQRLIDAVVNNPKGLVIVSGPTGSGKSTTSAVLIDHIKRRGNFAVTTLADPIEFIHGHGEGIVTQREIPSDVSSFEQGLISTFRLDPDIIEISEMRTTESVEAAIRFANSGHLVITTFHASSVISTIEAMRNKMVPEKQGELLSTLAQNTVAIVNQTLVEGVNGKIVPIFEYLIPDHTTRRSIMEGKTNELVSPMKTSGLTTKMIATWFDTELEASYRKGEITLDTYKRYLTDNQLKEQLRDSE